VSAEVNRSAVRSIFGAFGRGGKVKGFRCYENTAAVAEAFS
jgi:hypothetical protein